MKSKYYVLCSYNTFCNIHLYYQTVIYKQNLKVMLSQKALAEINTPATRIKLAAALEVTEQSIIKYIKANNDNLTKAAAMAVIRAETGLTDEQILTDSEEVVSNAS